VERMTPPEERHRYQELIGAFLLGELDEVERTAMQTHLSSCPVCQVEVRELEPVVAALADASPDRIDEAPLPPGDLEESTLAPILGEIHRARRRRRQFRWSALAAAAICVVAIGLAGFTWLLEPAVALEPLSFSVEPGMEVEGNLIEHDSGTEIRLVVSGLRDGQTYRVTLVSEDGERVNAGTFIGIGDKQLRGTFKAALLREDVDRLEVRTAGGELVFFAKLPEEPRVKVRDWPLFGILPWADPGLKNERMGASSSESTEGPTHKKPKDAGSGGGTPPKSSSPEGGGKRSSPGGEKPGIAPEEREPGGLPEPPPYELPPPDQRPPDGQYSAQP
jgi:Putative zinc-finger